MKLRDNKGSITVFVLVGLLFMSAFLLLSYGSNVNKSKTAKEMFNMVSSTYSYNDGDENAYMRAYTALRKQNAQEMTSSNEGKEDTSTLELTKTFYGPISNYKIYGNSIQDTTTYGTPSPTNPVEIQSVGDLVTDTADEKYGKYKIPVKVSDGRNLFNANAIKNTNIQVKDNGKNIIMPIMTAGNGYTTTGAKLSELCPDLNVGDVAILSFKSNTSTNPMIYLTGVADLWYRNTTRTITQEMLNSTVVLYGNRYMDGETIEKTITDLQIEKGTVVTEYEPYVQSQTFNIYLDEPLRKVGDVEDHIDFSTGTVERNIRELELTGNESWVYNGTTLGTYNYLFHISTSIDNKAYGNVLCNRLPKTTATSFTSEDQASGVYWGSKINFSINRKWLDNGATITTREEAIQLWKNYLSENPVKITYILDTPDDQQTIEIPELKSYEDYTKIEVLTEIVPSKIEVTYDGYTFEK